MVRPLRPYVKPRRSGCGFYRADVSSDRIEQMPRRMRYLFDRRVERVLVLLRRHAITTDLAYELKRGGVHFIVSRVLVGSSESNDASAHACRIMPPPRTRSSAPFCPQPAALPPGPRIIPSRTSRTRARAQLPWLPALMSPGRALSRLQHPNHCFSRRWGARFTLS